MVNLIAVLIAAIAIGAAGYFLFARKKSGTSSTTSGTLFPAGWSIINSKNMPAQMTRGSNGSYFFDFPNVDGVHYVVEAAPSLQPGVLVSMAFNVSGVGSVVPVQGNPPAKVSLFMQRKGDNLSGSGAYQQYRYWHSSAELPGGDGSLSATLTPDQWTDVYGKSGSDFPNQFSECVTNAEMIGMTFGDPTAMAAGHGAYAINGPARFTLKSFTIN